MNSKLKSLELLLKEKGISEEEYKPILTQIEKDLKNKKYGLIWEEKEEDVYNELLSKLPILKEVKEREIKTDNDKPTNLLIEGDNLHALKTLQYTHKESINVIYIDPPYNTGNKDFKYNDRFIDKDDNWRHSEWLSFMSKRLKLAKELLSNDGVIFISIDDNEMAQLKLLCDDIFGEENFIETLIRKTASSPRMDAKFISKEHEYLFIYAKDINLLKFNKQLINVEDDSYKFEDEYIIERGKYKLNKLDRGSISYSPSLDYTIMSPDNSIIKAGNGREGWSWRWSKEKLNWGIKNGFIEFKKNKERWNVYFKQYQYVNNKNEKLIRKQPYKSLLTDGFYNEKGKSELKELNLETLFSYPKPKDFIKHLINLHPNKNAIILDFFAGSGATGQAVLELDNEDNGNRQFILCTNNENNICEEVTYQRLNKVIKGYTTPKGKEVKGLGGNLKYYKVEF